MKKIILSLINIFGTCIASAGFFLKSQEIFFIGFGISQSIYVIYLIWTYLLWRWKLKKARIIDLPYIIRDNTY